MNAIVAEFVGSALLIVFGNGVVANVVLDKSKGQNSGWIVIAWGWAIAVFIAVYCVGRFSGAHLNPAVSFAMALTGKLSWMLLPQYLCSQLAGCMLGAALVWIVYRDHFNATTQPDAIQACFCTAPAIYKPWQNFITEALASLIFILAILLLTAPTSGLGSLEALPVALLVLGIGLSLGGPTGYAINPARDLGPRIIHAILPIRNKAGSSWHYAWVPVAGPIVGTYLAVTIHSFLIL
ncbi:MAG: aquaporin family protein [Saprospiraceae bacterium]|jgi:glycerol uptake facilitator protein|nr:aquaporin family protein [Saprospiraceae bacterium]MBP9193741.1 aquaporin family protein [Saprospiraceae bacterium]